MPKVLLTRHQFVNHVYYRAGENDVTDEVAKVLQKRGVLSELPKESAPPAVVPVAQPNKSEVKN
jgi:hypothetical protein